MRRYHYNGPDFEENGLGMLPNHPRWYQQGKFWGGVLMALLLGGFGLFSMVTLHSYVFIGRQGVMELFGLEALFAGGLYLCGGAVCHFAYFWPQSEKLFRYAQLLTYLALFLGGIFLVLLCWHMTDSIWFGLFLFFAIGFLVMIGRASNS